MEQTAVVNIEVNGKPAIKTLENLQKEVKHLSELFIAAENAGNKSLSERYLSQLNAILLKIENYESKIADIDNALISITSNNENDNFFSRIKSYFDKIFSPDDKFSNNDFFQSLENFFKKGGTITDLKDDFLNEIDAIILDGKLGDFIDLLERLKSLNDNAENLLKSNQYDPQLLSYYREVFDLLTKIKGLSVELPDFILDNYRTESTRSQDIFDKKLNRSRNFFLNSHGGSYNQQMQAELNAANISYYMKLDALLKDLDNTALNGYDKQLEKLKLLEDHLKTLLSIYEQYNKKGSSQWSRTEVRLTQNAQSQKNAEFKSRKFELSSSMNNELLELSNSYHNGDNDYQNYLEKRYDILLKYYQDCKLLFTEYGQTLTTGYQKLLEDESKLLLKHEKDIAKISHGEFLISKQKEQDELLKLYSTRGNILFRNEELLKIRLSELDVKYLSQELSLQEEGTASWLRTKESLLSKSRQKDFQEQRLYESKMLEWRKSHLVADYQDLLQIDLYLLDEMHKKEIVSQEEFEKIRAELIKRYRSEGISFKYEADFKDSGIGDQLRALSESFEQLINNSHSFEDVIEHIGEVSKNAFSIATMYLGAFSQYFKAEQDLEVAQVESSYDKKIKAAGSNQRKVKRLEAKKQSEIAKIKTKYNKREQKIEIAQAIASTALAAINAYASASKVNWLLGAIAAAMATAFGSIQIATIQKQHQAEQVGYYHGGFTRRDPNNNREVGVVHANEFVVNHDAVSNPHLSPFLRLIDEAQRNNTVGSLSSDDVSRAIGQGRYHGRLIAGQENVISHFDVGLSSLSSILIDQKVAIEDLRKSLNDGIEAYMVMDGEDGFYHRYRHFERLLSNPRR